MDCAGRRRRVDCQRCDGPAAGNLLLSPVALASGRDGALYVGDYNYIRRLSPGRDDVATILQLRSDSIVSHSTQLFYLVSCLTCICSLYLILPACKWLAPFAADVYTHTHTHPFNGPFFRDYPGGPVPET